MMRVIIAKNTSGGQKTWVNQILQDGDTYTITSESERQSWVDDTTVNSDLWLGDLTINDGVSDLSDSDGDKWLKGINLEIDGEGRQVQRAAYGKKGWTYLAHPIEFTTSKLSACYAKDWKNSDRNDFDFKFYNSSGTELVAGTQAELDANCVETRVTLKLDYDYEIISGKIDQKSVPTSDVRLWVVGGVIDSTNNYPWEYPASSGIYHVKEFAGGINLAFMNEGQEMETDGRASKFMCKTKTGVPYNANQFQFIIRHDAGYKHDLMILLEYFRA